MSAAETLTFTQAIDATPAAVYYAFTNDGAVREWWCNMAQMRVQEEGPFYLQWNQGYYVSGVYTAVVPGEKLAFTWRGRGEPTVTRVEILLAEADDGTKVTVRHRDVGDGAEWQKPREQLEQGWERSLVNLKSVLETGRDKRIFDRPMLGVTIAGVVGAEEAAESGLPIEGGVRISGTLAGSGADAAGLQEDDVIVRLAGTETPTLPALGQAVAPYKPGDQVSVDFVRGGEEHTVLLDLGQRPIPPIPAEPKAFAERLRKVQGNVNDELVALFAEVTGEQAARRPADGEWSALETVAHLLATERVLHLNIALGVAGQSPARFPPNPDGQVEAITAVYPTIDAMLDAFYTAEEETAALVAALPGEFVGRKASYLNLGLNLLQSIPAHSRSHFPQIRAALTVARESAPTNE